MRRTEAVVIGGGQAGLAMSRCLAQYGIDHVVLERGRVGERWRSERWDSLRLLSPNWHTRLPGFRYDGPDPDGYMQASELVGLLERYARTIAAPVEPNTTVLRVEASGPGYRVTTDRGGFLARSVVIATGYAPTNERNLGSRTPPSTRSARMGSGLSSTTNVLPVFLARSWRSVTSAVVSSAARPEVGSSRKRMTGSVTSSMAMLTRLRWPPDRTFFSGLPICRLRTCSRPSWDSVVSTRRSISSSV